MGPEQDVIEQAARWAAILDSGDMRDADRAACELWCSQDPLHRRTLDRMRAFHAQVESAADLEQVALRHMVASRCTRQGRAGGALLGVAILALGGWLVMQTGFVRDRLPDYETVRGEQQIVALEDGSELTIDTDGAVGVSLAQNQRRVRLIRGQLFAKVSKDRTRPFVVVTPQGTATALGTAFIVRRQDADMIVTVVESQVRVCPGTATLTDDRCRTLRPGQRARVFPTAVSRLADVEPGIATIWTTGWLEADDQEVAQILAELNRYRAQPIRYNATELSGVKVTGSFPLRDIDLAIEGVVRTADLDAWRSGNGEVTINRR